MKIRAGVIKPSWLSHKFIFLLVNQQAIITDALIYLHTKLITEITGCVAVRSDRYGLHSFAPSTCFV